MKNIYFLEEKSHVDFSLKDPECGRQDQSLIISMDPTATYFLEKQKIAFHIIETFYTPKEIMEMRSIQNIYIMQKITQLDLYLSELFLELENLPLMKYNYYSVNSLLSTIPFKIQVIKRIILKERPEEIVYFSSPVIDKESCVFIKQSTWSLVLHAVTSRLNIKTRVISSAQEFGVEFRDPVLMELAQKLKRKICRPYARRIRNKMADYKYYLSAGRDYTNNILFTSKSYELEYLINDSRGLKRFPLGLYFWDLDSSDIKIIKDLRRGNIHYSLDYGVKFDNFETRASRIWMKVSASEEFKNIFAIEEFNYYEIIAGRLKNIFIRNLPEIFFINYALPAVLKKFRIKVIVSPENFTHLRQAVFYHSLRKIPIVNLQHGPCFTDKLELWNYCCWKSSEVNLMFGRGLSDIAKTVNPRARYINVGSIAIDNLRPAVKKNGVRNIVYMVNNFSGSYTGFWRGLNCPDNLYYHYQSRIIRELLGYPEYNIYLKLHPSQEHRNLPLIDSLNHRSKKHVKIIKNAWYGTETISFADLLILDIPSTALLQGIKGGKKILLFNPLREFSLDRKITKMVRECTEYSEDIDEFTGVLQRYLKDSSLWIKKEGNGDQFLRMYATHLNDGKSCQKAAQEISALVNNFNDEA